MNANEVRGDEPGLMDAAQTDGPIGRCSVCRGEVRWSEAKRPLTSPPVHADCLEPLRDDRIRTPSHCKTCGSEVCSNCGQVYFNTSGMTCTDNWHQTHPEKKGAGVWTNCGDCGGLVRVPASAKRDDRTRTPPHGDPLRLGAATMRAMAGPEMPHNDAGVPIMRSMTGEERAEFDAIADAAIEAQRSPGSLPCHIERAARAAYKDGHRVGQVCGLPERECRCVELHGLDAFRESLQADADEAVSAADHPGGTDA